MGRCGVYDIRGGSLGVGEAAMTALGRVLDLAGDDVELDAALDTALNALSIASITNLL